MTRRERLLATLRGEPTDRPPVSFYELNGLDENPDDHDPFNIYAHPSWRPLIDLTKEKTDCIVMRCVPYICTQPDPVEELTKTETFLRDGSRFTIQSIQASDRTLTSRTRRDPDTNTVWTLEHLLKDTDDLKAFLELPVFIADGEVQTDGVIKAESVLGDNGIVMIDTPDPLCQAASLFDMADYTVIAMTEQELFHRLIERCAAPLWKKTGAVAKALPGHLWRIYGPEYASPPYLPSYLFNEYVCQYVKPMIDSIHKYDGYARIHSHGNLKKNLDALVAMGIDGLDPIEPPPQGDVELLYVQERYGKEVVLFGNLEITDIENLPTDTFAEKVKRALDEGTSGNGRGFVLMPSACPYGRELSSLTVKNYEQIIEIVERF